MIFLTFTLRSVYVGVATVAGGPPAGPPSSMVPPGGWQIAFWCWSHCQGWSVRFISGTALSSEAAGGTSTISRVEESGLLLLLWSCWCCCKSVSLRWTSSGGVLIAMVMAAFSSLEGGELRIAQRFPYEGNFLSPPKSLWYFLREVRYKSPLFFLSRADFSVFFYFFLPNLFIQEVSLNNLLSVLQATTSHSLLSTVLK